MFFYNLVSWRRFFCRDGRTFKRLGPVESSPSVCSGGSSSGREDASRPEDPGSNPIVAGLSPHLLLLSSIDFFSRQALGLLMPKQPTKLLFSLIQLVFSSDTNQLFQGQDLLKMINSRNQTQDLIF